MHRALKTLLFAKDSTTVEMLLTAEDATNALIREGHIARKRCFYPRRIDSREKEDERQRSGKKKREAQRREGEREEEEEEEVPPPLEGCARMRGGAAASRYGRVGMSRRNGGDGEELWPQVKRQQQKRAMARMRIGPLSSETASKEPFVTFIVNSSF
ncbi:hypothetical protein B296_00017998 [Ensete ventricosum]|uniref:Uncharacterized protein n=1 Tax=Ensete ventricosum TaxID=4639 RepID=A0A426ZRP0_ENSVE|nr:hypothetical protein B296_00017998 [Ensete ventricosum]